MADSPGKFAGELRELRRRARLTQQELADTAGLSLRTVSDLERGVATTPQKETVRLLADALHLPGPERAQFETSGRGRPLASVALPAAAAAMRSLPRDVASFTGRRQEFEPLAAPCRLSASCGSRWIYFSESERWRPRSSLPNWRASPARGPHRKQLEGSRRNGMPYQ
jgi:transcriptional regulator with XRE-family HTH domain